MKDSIRWYVDTWMKIMKSPADFFRTLPEGVWYGDSLTFAGATAWILAFIITIVIFLIKLIEIGLYLTETLSLLEKVLTLPITIVFSAVIFAIVVLIVGGFMLAAIIGLLYAVGSVLQFILRLMGGGGMFFDMIKASLYSAAVFMLAAVPVAMSPLVKYRLISMWTLSLIENVVYYLACAAMFILWVAAGEAVNKVPRWKAVMSALLPIAVLVLFGVLFHTKVFPSLEKFLI